MTKLTTTFYLILIMAYSCAIKAHNTEEQESKAWQEEVKNQYKLFSTDEERQSFIQSRNESFDRSINRCLKLLEQKQECSDIKGKFCEMVSGVIYKQDAWEKDILDAYVSYADGRPTLLESVLSRYIYFYNLYREKALELTKNSEGQSLGYEKEFYEMLAKLKASRETMRWVYCIIIDQTFHLY